MKTTIKEVEEAMKELKDAMTDFINLDIEETDIKLKKQKAQKRLSLAKDEVRALQFN